jgi:hypothetical protein
VLLLKKFAVAVKSLNVKAVFASFVKMLGINKDKARLEIIVKSITSVNPYGFRV